MTSSEKPSPCRWGGARPGAGRKPLAEALVHTSVNLPADVIARAKEIGDGRVGAGIAIAVRTAWEIFIKKD